MVKVSCGDLIGREWIVGKTDCLLTCVDLLRRAHMDKAADALSNLTNPDRCGVEWVAVDGGLKSMLRIGDIILSKGKGGVLHTSAVCDDVARRVISASMGRGVYSVPYTRLPNVIEVYRYHD